MGSPCVANVIVPASRLRYLKDKEQERRRCSEQRVWGKGWGTKKGERTERKMSKECAYGRLWHSGVRGCIVPTQCRITLVYITKEQHKKI